jgi:hypothetical protein
MTDESWAAHKAMLEAHESFHNLELTRRNDVGELRYISLSGEPVFDAAGGFCGYRGVGRDITAPKRVEEALRKSGRRAQNIEGREAARWILIDFGDVVVHVFQEEIRPLYDLEGLWEDARRVPPPST